MLNAVLSIRANLSLLALIIGLSGCHGRYTRAPYQKERPPLPATLLSATHPRIKSIRVQKGKIQQNHRPHASLLLIAQLPTRLRATIHFAGQELLTLALNESSYGLRYLQDQNLSRGFYHGPPADCAVSELLGVAIPSEDLVRLILGGGPKISHHPTILAQSWSGKRGGFERLVIQDGNYQRELRFSWMRDSWWFQGMSSRNIGSELSSNKWEWSLDHERFTEINGIVVPIRTIISRPDRRRRTEVKIVFDRVQINPQFSGGNRVSSAPEDDDWDDEGWENASGEFTTDRHTAKLDPTPKVNSNAPAIPTIPPEFVLHSAGLQEQGDLCRPKFR